MDPEGMVSDCPSLPSTKRVSFALLSGAHEALDFAGVPASPVTPIFKSEFVHGFLGAHKSVNDAFSSLGSNGVAPLSLLELKQSALVSPEKISAQSKLCCGGVISANSDRHWSSAIVSDELDLAGALKLGALEKESGAVGCNLTHDVPAADPGLHQEPEISALPPSGAGLLDAALAPPVDLKRDSQIRARPSSGTHVERSEECGEKSHGRSWPSVVTQSSFGGMSQPKFYPLKYSSVENSILSPPDDVRHQGEEIWRATLVGYCLGNPIHYNAVNNITRKIWARFGLQHVARNESGFFFFCFASTQMMDKCLNSGPWSIAGHPFF